MEPTAKPRPAWIARLLDGRAEGVSTDDVLPDDVLMVTVMCDGLSRVERAEGSEAADHIRRIMTRLLCESDENAVVQSEGDTFTLLTTDEDFDPQLWAIRMENSFRRAIADAGYGVAVAFELGGSVVDEIAALPEERFYLN